MNANLLLKVRDHILADPEHFAMRSFVERTKCGTVCCIAGWAVALNDDGADHLPDFTDKYIAERAQELLEVGCERLFYPMNWPFQFKQMYVRALLSRDKVGLATVAADRINHFIATKGRE